MLKNNIGCSQFTGRIVQSRLEAQEIYWGNTSNKVNKRCMRDAVYVIYSVDGFANRAEFFMRLLGEYFGFNCRKHKSLLFTFY